MRRSKENVFVDLLPSSLKNDPFVFALAEAVEMELKQAYKEAESMSDLNNVDKLPESLLDYLAYQRHVDFYDSSLPIEQKRILVKKAPFFHRYKGTPGAVEELVTTIFGEGKVVEWFDYDGAPFRFKVVTNNPAAIHEKAALFIKAVETVKNKRSRLEKVELTQLETMNLYFAGVIHTGEKITLRQVN